MAVSISLSITQNSQSIADNTSNVTVKVTAKWTNGSWNAQIISGGTPQAHGSLTIDGTSYDFRSTFNTGHTTSGSQTIFTKTVDISHNSDGTKTLSCSASYSTYVSSGTVSASASKELTTIPRKSTLTVANGTLGTAQTLTITEKASTFKHKLKYTCGSASGWILGGSDSFSTSNSVSWTPPLTLAQQNTTGTSVSVTFTLYTYTSGGVSVGSNAYTKTFSIPSSVKPSVSVAVSDPMGYATTYGAYVQGLSKLKIVATASGSQGSTIKSYKTEADGKTYTTATAESGVIAGTGTLTIKVTVTDSRGRTATASTTITVLAYEPPKISALAVYRCDTDGKESSSGAYLAVKFSSLTTSLGNKNTAGYSVEHKKSSASQYTKVTLTNYAGQYSVSDGVFVFAAETASSYNITLTVTDAFGSATKTAVGSSVKKVWSLLKKAGEIVGIAFDKIAEHEGVFEIGFQTLFTGGIRHPVIEPATDLNDIRTPNTYVGANVSTYNYANCPLTTGTFTLEVVGMGVDGQVKQRLTYCHKTASRTWERIYYSSAWGEWICVSDFGGKLLWSGGYYMTADHTVQLSEAISKQPSGIVLVFSGFSAGATENHYIQSFFVPKYVVSAIPGGGHTFILSTNLLNVVAAKYLYISDNTIKGADGNKETGTGTGSGIAYNNQRFVLRYVIGV